MREIAANGLRTFAILSVIVGVMLTILYGGYPFWANGRLTDFSCYLILGVFFYAFAYVWRIEYKIRKGLIEERSLPFWLRND